jgi:hypothetical protein
MRRLKVRVKWRIPARHRVKPKTPAQLLENYEQNPDKNNYLSGNNYFF